MLSLFFIAALAASEPTPPPEPPAWPVKGDTIFVSATLKSETLGGGVVLHMPTNESVTAACSPLQVKKSTPAKERWIVRNVTGWTLDLRGPWPGRMHRDEAECVHLFQASGEPRVSHSLATHVIQADK